MRLAKPIRPFLRASLSLCFIFIMPQVCLGATAEVTRPLTEMNFRSLDTAFVSFVREHPYQALVGWIRLHKRLPSFLATKPVEQFLNGLLVNKIGLNHFSMYVPKDIYDDYKLYELSLIESWLSNKYKMRPASVTLLPQSANPMEVGVIKKAEFWNSKLPSAESAQAAFGVLQYQVVYSNSRPPSKLKPQFSDVVKALSGLPTSDELRSQFSKESFIDSPTLNRRERMNSYAQKVTDLFKTGWRNKKERTPLLDADDLDREMRLNRKKQPKVIPPSMMEWIRQYKKIPSVEEMKAAGFPDLGVPIFRIYDNLPEDLKLNASLREEADAAFILRAWQLDPRRYSDPSSREKYQEALIYYMPYQALLKRVRDTKEEPSTSASDPELRRVSQVVLTRAREPKTAQFLEELSARLKYWKIKGGSPAEHPRECGRYLLRMLRAGPSHTYLPTLPLD